MTPTSRFRHPCPSTAVRIAAILSEHEFNDYFNIIIKKSNFFNVVHYRIGTFCNPPIAILDVPNYFGDFYVITYHYLTTNCGHRELLLELEYNCSYLTFFMKFYINIHQLIFRNGSTTFVSV